MLKLQLFKTMTIIGSLLLLLGLNIVHVSSQGADDILTIAWSPSGDRIATGHRDGTVNIWDAETNLLLHTMQGDSQGVYLLIWKPDGTQLIGEGSQTSVKVWDTATGNELATLELTSVYVVLGGAWSLQGDQIYTWGGDANPNFFIWDAQNFQFISKDNFGGDTQEIIWNPANTIGALVNSAGQVILVDAQTLDRIRYLDEPETALGTRTGVYEVDWHSSGNRLISGSGGGNVRVWDVNTGNILLNMTAMASPEGNFYTQIVRALRYSGDERFIHSVAGDGTLRSFDAQTGTIVSEINLSSSVLAADWNPDMTRLAYSDVNGALNIVGQPAPEAGPNQNVVDLDNDGSEMVTLDGTGSPESGSYINYAWTEGASGVSAVEVEVEIGSGPTPTVNLGVGVHTITLTVINNHGLTGTDTVVVTVQTLPLADAEISVIAWSPSGDRIATGHRDGTVNIWDAETNLLLHTMQGNSQGVYLLIWKPDGTQLIGAGSQTSVKVWDTATGNELATLEMPAATFVGGAAWSLQGDQIYTWGLDTYPSFWDAQTFQFVATDNFGGDTIEIVWNPAHTIGALVNGAGQVILVDAQTLDTIRYLDEPETARGGRAGVYKVDWHSSGNRLISGNTTGNVRIWDVNTGTILLNMTAMASTVESASTRIVLALRYSEDERFIHSVAGDGTLRTFDPLTGTIVHETSLSSSVLAADWNPDMTRLAYSDVNGNLNIIDHPFTEAGPTQMVNDTDGNGTEVVTLDGTGSNDPDGTIISYQWTEMGGGATLLEDEVVIGSGPNPDVTLGIGTHTITVITMDDHGLTGSDEVVITVMSFRW